MGRLVFVLTTSAFVLTRGVLAGSAQQVPDVPTMQQPQNLQEQLQRQLQGIPSPRRVVEDDIDEDGWMTGWRDGPRWRQHHDWDRGYMGYGPVRGGAMVGSGGLHSRMMMRMLFALMDSDGDGTVSLQEFQTAHERIFKSMDANKDSRLTLEEIQAFTQAARRSGQQQ
jgi:hypothetical protein